MNEDRDFPKHAAHWDTCVRCGRTTWVSTEENLCTEPNGAKKGCKWNNPDSRSEMVDEPGQDP